jgi:hypothetical protein
VDRAHPHLVGADCRRHRLRSAGNLGGAIGPALVGPIKLHFTNSGVIVGTDPLKERLGLWQRGSLLSR